MSLQVLDFDSWHYQMFIGIAVISASHFVSVYK